MSEREAIQFELATNAIVTDALGKALAQCTHAGKRRALEERIRALWAERGTLLADLEFAETLDRELAARGLRLLRPGEPGGYCYATKTRPLVSVWVTDAKPAPRNKSRNRRRGY